MTETRLDVLVVVAACLLACGCATHDEAEAARSAEERFERVAVVSDAGHGSLEHALAVEGISFAPGSARLNADAKSRLGSLVEWLRSGAWVPEITIHVSEEARRNPELARKRAEAVRGFLYERGGIALDRIVVVSAMPHDSQDGRAAAGEVMVIVHGG